MIFRRNFLILAVAFLFANNGFAAHPDYRRSDSLKVVKLLTEATALDAETNYVLYFARKLQGIPYVAKTLEYNSEERLVVNLRQLDCTTFVETVLALTRCMYQKTYTFAAYCDNLRQIRYKDGKINYPNRLHYFTSWIENNEKMGIVKSVPTPNPPFSAVQTVWLNYMTVHVKAYLMLVKHPEWIPQIRQMEREITGKRYRYIPKSQLGDTHALRKAVQDGDIIVILSNKKGLDTNHIAFAVWHKDGLHMIDASSIYKKVIEEPKLMSTYMNEHPAHLGLRIVRLQR